MSLEIFRNYIMYDILKSLLLLTFPLPKNLSFLFSKLATLLVLLTFRVDIPGVFLRQRACTLAWDRWCHVPRWTTAAVGDD